MNTILTALTRKEKPSFLEVFLVFLRLGLTSFGGPVAHLGYFRTEFVERRRWLDETHFAGIMALCQFLPGPASSQLGMTIGLLRARLMGAVAAWAGFTLPSALIMALFAYGTENLSHLQNAAWLHGLKIVAVAVVAHAVRAMARSLCPDWPRKLLMLGAALVMLLVPSTVGQIAVIVLGGFIGWLVLPGTVADDTLPMTLPIPRHWSIAALTLFFTLLAGLPLLAEISDNQTIRLFDSFYRAGSLVFGGGHVVLPLLQAETVQHGLIPNDTFLAGYGAAQAVPGPLFTFAAYLGMVIQGWMGALTCLTAIFLPSFLLIIGGLPFWNLLRHQADVQLALRGVNASVVGLLLSTLCDPVWTSAIFTPMDFALALTAFLLLSFGKPPWLVVILGVVAAMLAA